MGRGRVYQRPEHSHCRQWVIRRNLFKNFHTPDTAAYLWDPAVSMWNHSTNTLTERNTFIVDRAIAYGLYDNSGSDHQGGVIRKQLHLPAAGA